MPISCERDCGDTNCSSSLSGPTTLPFTPNSNQLGFTLDGGLLAYGLVPLTNLTWGYVGGGNYAQEALSIQDGAYEIAGIYLPAGQTTVATTELAAALLFSGFGDGTNNEYVERPGETNYTSGFANYAGHSEYSARPAMERSQLPCRSKHGCIQP